MKAPREIRIHREPGEVLVSFRNHGTLCLLKTEHLLAELKSIVQQNGTRLVLDLHGVLNLNTTDFDTLNLLSRLARKYGSHILLTGVEPPVMELIELAREYSVFDIKQVEPVLEDVFEE